MKGKVKRTVKITQSQSDAAVRGFILYTYQQPLFQRLRFMYTVLVCKGFGRFRLRTAAFFLFCFLVSFLAGTGIGHFIIVGLRLFK